MHGVWFFSNFGRLLLLFLEIVVNSERETCLSVVEVAKSVRDRWIRVAAIVIVISEGSRNICVVYEYECLPYVAVRKNVQG